MLHEAVVAYARAGDRLGEARALGDLATTSIDLGDRDGALGYAERARAIFQDLGDAEGQGRILRFLAIEAHKVGNVDAALDLAEQAVRQFELASATALAAETEMFAARTHRANGDVAQAVELARRAARRAPAERQPDDDLFLQLVEAEWAMRELLQADSDAAREAVLARHPALLGEVTARIAAHVELLSAAPDEKARANAAAGIAWLLAHPDGAAAGWYAEEWDTILRYAGAGDLPAGLEEQVRRLVVSQGADHRAALDNIIAMLTGEERAAVRGWYLLQLARLDMDESDRPRAQKNAGAAAELLARAGANDEAAEAYVLEGAAWRQDRSGDLRGNSDRALRALRQALRLYRRSTHPDEWAKTISNLGNVYWQYPDDRRRNLARAVARHTAALTVLTPDRHRTDWATAHANLGLVLSESVLADDPDNLERGRVHLSRALDGLDAARSRAVVLLNLSRCYRLRKSGDHEANAHLALRHAREAYDMFEGFGTPVDLADAARAVADSLSMLRTHSDAVTEAIEWYHRALAMVPPDHFPRDHAALAGNLANTLVSLAEPTDDQLGEAIALQRTAVDLYGRSNDPWEQARARYNLATTLLESQQQPDLDEVLDLHERSLAVFQVERGSREWTESATAFASTLLLRGHDQDQAQAVRLLREVTASTALAGAPHQAAHVWSLLGEVHARDGDWTAAAQALRHAVDAAESRYAAAVLAMSRVAELERLGGLPRFAAYALARAGDPKGAVALLESARARELGRLFDRDHLDLSVVDRLAPDAAAAYREASQRIAALEARQRAAPQPSREDSQQIHAALTDAYAQLRSATETVRRVPGASVGLGRAAAETVEQAVAAGCPLAYLVTTGHGSVILLAGADPSGTVEALYCSLTEQELVDTVLHAGAQHSPAVLDLIGDGFMGDLAHRLTELGHSRVVLIPTGVLGIVPLHAARYRRDGQLVHLVDEVAPSYAPSARVLLAAHGVPVAAQDELRLVAVADPVPDAAPLPWAREEVATLERIFPGPTRSMTGSAATKPALLAALPGRTHVHLACHGAYDADEPMRSSLQLARDERLTLRELFDGKRLAGVQLVVASACQSAVTDVLRAQDEATGLPAGLAYAGARTIIGTLWAVEDRSAELLVSRFYVNHLLGDPDDDGGGPMPPASALARAQQWLRDAAPADVQQFTRDLAVTPAAGGFTDPAHWAAFVVHGAA
ncbi:CHAT domain-containing tetratricopeptide repeat protein [Asanoa siamensis]|nr:CHAT domain-containing protein [Asanoa siamensis]